MSQQEIINLLDRYLTGNATTAEQERVEVWLESQEDLNNGWVKMDESARTQFLSTLYIQIRETISVSGTESQTNVVTMRRWWLKWVAAAAVLFVGFSLWIFVARKGGDQDKPPVAVTTDVAAPQTARAQITLANGQIVYLDSVGNGTLAQEGGVILVKSSDGKVIYTQQAGPGSNELVYNTLTNPRGSKVIDMQLADGSHVWLNAASSVRYPVAFVGSERKVEITGEAYFEVTHNASKPFIVTKGEISVKVLGTHFNVNAYNDESDIRVTLLEGSVEVKNQKSKVKIRPGQQAQIDDSRLTIHDADVDEVMAWKNGKFSFNKVDIKTVMRQLARWYDLEIVYEGEVSQDKFWGDIQRDLPLSKTLDFLKKSQVHFEVEGKKVIVKK